jgi:hypothetical protein
VLLIILARPSVAPEPSERPLDNPPLGYHFEARDVVASPYDQKRPEQIPFRPEHELACVAAIGPDERQSREEPFCSLEQQFRSVTILNVRLMHLDFQDETQGINEDMALATFDFLACIIATRPPFSVVFTV